MIKETKIKLIRYFGMIFVVTLTLGLVTFFRGPLSAGLRTSEFPKVAPLEKVTAIAEIIVKIKSGNEATVASAAGVDASQVAKTTIPNIYLVTIPKGKTADSLIQKITAGSNIDYAEKNYRAWIGADDSATADSGDTSTTSDTTDTSATTTGDTTKTTTTDTTTTTKEESTVDTTKKVTTGPKITNDPMSGSQWGLSLMKITAAWKKTTGEGSLKVAVVDTGIAMDHPDLVNTSFVDGVSFVKGAPAYYDEHGHGTHVTGLIAATTNNNIGIAGLAWKVSVMPVRVADRRGVTDNMRIAEGISYAANHGAKLINVSLYAQEGTKTLYNTIDYATRVKGCTVVASTGTGAKEKVGYPAAYPGVIAVSAVDQDLQPAFFARNGSEVDIAAPGQDVISTIPFNSVVAPTNRSGYGTLNGTSMSTGYVTGCAALLLSYDSSLRPEQVYKRLAGSATKVKAMGGISKTSQYGYGIVNAASALILDTYAPTFKSTPKEETVSIKVAGTITDDKNSKSVMEYLDVSDSNIGDVQYRYDQEKTWQSFGGKMAALSPATIDLNIMKPAVLGDHTLYVRADDTSGNFSNTITFKFNVNAEELAAIKAATEKTSASVTSEGYVPSSNFIDELNKMRALMGLAPVSESDFRRSTTKGVDYDYVTPFGEKGGSRPADDVNPFYGGSFF